MTTVRDLPGIDVPVGTWEIDPSHSEIGFSVRHLGIAKVRGRFGSFSGRVTVAEEAERSSVEVSIDAASIDTRDDKRDGHLRSPDFLDAERFPALGFRSTSVTRTGDDWEVAGQLTIHGETRPVTLRTSFEGLVEDPWGSTRGALSATTEINREDFGLTWNQALETGGVMVGKNVRIHLEVELVRQG